jgi:two-component system sensor histidine kinase/response regulator
MSFDSDNIKTIETQIQEMDRERNQEYVLELNNIAADLIAEGNLGDAKSIIIEALSVSSVIDDDEGKAFAYGNLGNYYFSRGMADSVIALLNEPYTQLQHTSRAINIGNLIATAHRENANYSEALQIYYEVLKKAEAEGNQRMQAAIKQNIAGVYESLGDYPAAIDHYLESLDLAEKSGDSQTRAVVLENLGTLNMSEENYELAEIYINQSLEINLDLGNPRYISGNYINLGIFYKSTGRFDEALESYQKALDLGDQMGNIVTKLQIYYNIGVLHNEMGNYGTALEYFQESLEMSRQNSITIGSFYNYSGMGDSYRNLENFSEAIQYFENALEIAESLSQVEFIKSILNKLWLAYESSGDTAAALEYLKRYNSVTDSIATTERKEALARQETLLNLRTERQNRELAEAALASQRNTLIRSLILLVMVAIALVGLFFFYQKKNRINRQLLEKTVELEEVNSEKDKLLSILAHDLRNPLSSLQGVVYLIQEGALNNQDMGMLLKEVDHRLQHGITILSNYLQWAQNQKDGIEENIEPVNVKEIVDECLIGVRHSSQKKGVTIEIEVQENLTMLADKNMMQVILRNLISNSIKYVDEDGVVTVKAVEENNRVKLSVSDNGVGIPELKKRDIFKSFSYTRIGTRGETGTGLGLSICKDFAEKQGGSISFVSENGEGTTFTVELMKGDISEKREVITE